MPEHVIHRCLALCRQAHALDGDAQRCALKELETALKLAAALLSAEEAGRKSGAETETDALPSFTMDPAGYITGWNDSAARLFGYMPDEAVGQHVLFLYAEDDTSEVAELYAKPDNPVMEVRRRKKSGEVFRAHLTLSAQKDGNGNPVSLTALLSEIPDGLTSDERVRLHARIFEDSAQGIMIVDNEEHIVSVNPAFTRITGYSATDAIGQTPDILRSGKHSANFRREVHAAMHGSGPWHGEIIGRRKNGELFPQSVTISVIRNEQGEITHAFSIFTDISAHKEAEARMANYDSLTGLPNRTLFDQLASQALLAARRNSGHGAVLVIGPHRLSAINDTLGHEAGDDLLSQMSQRFRKALRDEDVLARIEGHKFAVGLFDIQKREHAGLVAQKLIATLADPIVVGEHDLRVGLSIGIAVFPEDGMDPATLLQFAEAAMSKLKQNNDVGYLFFSQEMNQRAKEHLWFESELRRALSGDQLQLYYQPKVSLRNGRIVGAEGLIRWNHPERGMISPGVFVAIAEETGLILDIGTWVLDEACRQIRAWLDAGVDPPPIAVNLSPRQFDRHLAQRVHAALERHNIAPERLKLEITESLLVRGPDKVIPIMNELAAMGLALALDDFGTGYSSLAYLKKFPISTLKIDRAFVIGLPKEENDCAIARAIVTMGQQLRQEIVAEGVETMEQMAFLRELGCDQLQGYLFSKPVTADEFAQMVREGKRLALNR